MVLYHEQSGAAFHACSAVLYVCGSMAGIVAKDGSQYTAVHWLPADHHIFYHAYVWKFVLSVFLDPVFLLVSAGNRCTGICSKQHAVLDNLCVVAAAFIYWQRTPNQSIRLGRRYTICLLYTSDKEIRELMEASSFGSYDREIEDAFVYLKEEPIIYKLEAFGDDAQRLKMCIRDR